MGIALVNIRAYRSFARLIWFLIGSTFGVMVLGALVRAKDAGLSCPDWPLCYGQLVPIFDLRIFLEWFHRLLAAGACALTLVVAYRIFKSPDLRKHFRVAILGAIFLFSVQVVLGGLTVLQLIDPKIVSLHLINAVGILALLFWMVVKAEALATMDNQTIRNRKLLRADWILRPLYLILAVLMFAQIFVGGMVSTNFAAVACPDFPTCFGMWIPPYSFPVWLQMSHRYMAYCIVLLTVLLYFASRNLPLLHYAKQSSNLLPVFVLFQGVLGYLNVRYGAPPLLSVLHLANALFCFFLCCMPYFEFRAYYQVVLDCQNEPTLRPAQDRVQVGVGG